MDKPRIASRISRGWRFSSTPVIASSRNAAIGKERSAPSPPSVLGFVNCPGLLRRGTDRKIKTFRGEPRTVNRNNHRRGYHPLLAFGRCNVRTIKDETELPTPVAPQKASDPYYRAQQFLRSKSAPTVIMDCRTGECFSRADGENWKHPAYERDREGSYPEPKNWEPLTRKGAYCDDAIYDKKTKAAA